jgi:predicted alpha/beta-hydrolase family hydrolase
VSVPLLFLQGTRDDLADLELMRRVVGRLGEQATLHVIDGGDHSFKVPRAAGRSFEAVLAELAESVVSWSGTLGPM